MKWTLLFAFLLTINSQLASQAGIAIGISDTFLVKLNLETAAVVPFATLDSLPDGAELRNLVYVPEDQAFYSTLYTQTAPTLVRVRGTGEWEEVGKIRLYDGQLPHACEGLAYDEATQQMYVTVSMNDVPQGEDQVAEALLTIDRQTGICAPLATLRANPPPNDLEEIAIFQGQLFCFHGTPTNNNTYVFSFPISRLSGELFAGTKQNIPYFTMEDVLVKGPVLYFPHSKDQSLYYYDLVARKYLRVGRFHSRSKVMPEPIRLTGLAYLPLAKA